MTQPPRQVPFRLPVEPAMNREALAVSDANRQAVSLIEQWPDWPSPYAILAGPTGSGKTHLATIWGAAARASVHPANDIPSRLPDGNGAIIVEDLKPSSFDEVALFHLMNHVRQSGGTMLMTSQSWPNGWGVQTPDLLSRLRSATTVEIGEPDDELLKAVMLKLFADRQIAVESGVIDYLAARIERSVRTAIALVDALDMAALSKKSAITKPLAAQVLGTMDSREPGLDF